MGCTCVLCLSNGACLDVQDWYFSVEQVKFQGNFVL